MEDPVILKIKRWCTKRGNNGIRSLVQWFRRADKNKDAKLSYEEFSNTLKECGLSLTDHEIRHLAVAFDNNGDGSIVIAEFLMGLSGGMTPRRKCAVERVWEIFDRDRDDNVALDQVLNAYRIENHPMVLTGQLSEQEAGDDFYSFFNYETNPEGLVSKEEFFAFYAGVGQNIADDEYFENRLYGVWGVETFPKTDMESFGTVRGAFEAGKKDPVLQGSVASHKRPPVESAVLQQNYASYGPNTRNYNTAYGQSKKGRALEHTMVQAVAVTCPPTHESTYTASYKSLQESERPLTKLALPYANPPPKPAAQTELTAAAIVDEMRRLIMKKGGRAGYRGLTRVLRIMDDNGNKKLDKYELQNGIQTYGLHLNAKQMDEVMETFDLDGSGEVSVSEFLQVLRGPMSRDRMALVQQAYMLLDQNGDERVSFEEMKQLIDVKRHPDVLHKERTAPQVLQEFISGWDKSGTSTVSWDEFCDYYTDLSAGIDDDEYFEMMMRNLWHISGGNSQFAAGACRRVLVTHTDGKQSVREILNDLRIGPDDTQAMMENLQAQGVVDVRKISPVM